MTDNVNTKKRKKEKAAKEVAGDGPTTSRGRNYTLALAVASSVVGQVRNISYAAAVAAQIARAAVAGMVDEVVVYDDDRGASEGTSSFLSLALQYLETPPYLRNALCPLEGTWQTALQKLGAIGAPHHLGQTEWMPYREGVVLKSSPEESQGAGGHAFIDAGLDRMVYVPLLLPMMARVTLFLGDQPTSKFVSEYSETMIIAEVSQ
jgi:predicted SPOUT superfamily RNA methylase MTH1